MNQIKPIMRLLILFDVPNDTKLEQKQYRKLIKSLEREGFLRYQYSIYVRTCINYNDVNNCIGRLQPLVSKIKGEIQALTITDKQFSKIIPLNNTLKKKTAIQEQSKRILTI